MIKVKKQKIGDMKQSDIVGDYKTTSITYFDGNKRTLFYTQQEVFLQDNEKIISCADPEGNITLVNAAFVRMSGYSQQELVGVPQYILRHPDMPKIAFEQMWAELKAKGQWHGYVKNLRKDGAFYWVYASIFSNYRNGELVGYTSSRIAASPDKVIASMRGYAKLLEKESRA